MNGRRARRLRTLAAGKPETAVEPAPQHSPYERRAIRVTTSPVPGTLSSRPGRITLP